MKLMLSADALNRDSFWRQSTVLFVSSCNQKCNFLVEISHAYFVCTENIKHVSYYFVANSISPSAIFLLLELASGQQV